VRKISYFCFLCIFCKEVLFVRKSFGNHFNSVEEIIDSLQSIVSSASTLHAQHLPPVVFAKETLEAMKKMSPTSLKLTMEHIRRGKDLPLADCLNMVRKNESFLSIVLNRFFFIFSYFL
jgi:hypothetical protein